MKFHIPFILKIILLLALLSAVWQPAVSSATDQETLAGPPPVARTDVPVQVKEAGETVSLVFAIIKVIGSLVLVVGLMLLLAFAFKKIGLAGGGSLKSGSLIKIMDTRLIAPKKYVSVLQIADEFVAVGITDQNINLLGKLERSEELADFVSNAKANAAEPFGSSFSSLLQKAGQAISNPKNRKGT